MDQQHQLAWEAIRTRNLVFTPDLLTQNLQIPGESCSQYSLRSASFEAQLYHPVFAPSLGADSQRGPGGVATWSPAPSRLCSEHLDPGTPAPSASAGLPPGAHLPADRWSRFSCLLGRRGWPELGLEGWRCSCLSRRFLRAQKRSAPEVGRTGVGLGAGSAPPSAVLPSGSKLRGPGIPACQVVMRVYFTVC